MDSFVALFRVVSQCRSGSLFKKQSNELKFCFRFETEFKMASLWNCGVLKKKKINYCPFDIDWQFFYTTSLKKKKLKTVLILKMKIHFNIMQNFIRSSTVN